MRDSAFIEDAKLAVHGSTGAQLLPITEESYVGNGVTLTRNADGSYTPTGAPITQYVAVVTFTNIKLSPGVYCVSGGNKVIELQLEIVKNDVKLYKTGVVEIDGTETAISAQIQCNSLESYDSAPISFLINVGEHALPIEPYTGGTPYTGKYKPTITAQTGNTVTLSIENVSATEGDTTELDVVLTDKNGVTKRSEVGKPFIGGGES